MNMTTMELTPEKVHKVRRAFFERLENEWSRAPERIDSVMGQAQYYVAPEEIHSGPSTGGERICDVEHGLLLRSFLVSSERNSSSPYSTAPAGKKEKERTLRFFYSILQAGDWLRFGILIRGDQSAHDLINARRQMDLERVWDRSADIVQRGADSLLIEWRFVEPDFYHNFAIQERFVQVARHLHFRLGWAIDRHFGGFDEEDAREIGDMDGLDGGRGNLFFPEANSSF